jgi:pimeloyl-ACP methyl ester carboxylesterase
LGGNICLRYTGIHPDKVRKLVAIEGLGPSPKVIAERGNKPISQRMTDWIDEQRKLSARAPRKYPTIEDAFKRMQDENKHLSAGQARHLTEQGVNQNEDGTYSWKFDNYVRVNQPYDMSYEAIEELWSRITCPTLLVYGKESWASNPEKDGRIKHFKTAEVVEFERAGHWVQHDRLDDFVATTREFIK